MNGRLDKRLYHESGRQPLRIPIGSRARAITVVLTSDLTVFGADLTTILKILRSALAKPSNCGGEGAAQAHGPVAPNLPHLRLRFGFGAAHFSAELLPYRNQRAEVIRLWIDRKERKLVSEGHIKRSTILIAAALALFSSQAAAQNWGAVGSTGIRVDKDSLRRGDDGLIHFTDNIGMDMNGVGIDEQLAMDCSKRLTYELRSDGILSSGTAIVPNSIEDAELNYICANSPK